jgi:hypothetical protein
MLVRAAHGGRSHRVIVPGRRSTAGIIVALLVVSLPTMGCLDRGNLGPAVKVTWTLRPSTATVGPAVLTVNVRDFSGTPVRNAKIRLEGHMSHAGMTPVVAHGAEREPGVYDVPFEFTMAGDWVLRLTAQIAYQGQVEVRIDQRNVRASDTGQGRP